MRAQRKVLGLLLLIADGFVDRTGCGILGSGGDGCCKGS